MDIVEELRGTTPRDSGYAETANRAADEIERLRAKLKNGCPHLDRTYHTGGWFCPDCGARGLAGVGHTF